MKLNPFSIGVEYHLSADRISAENPGKIDDSIRVKVLEEAIKEIPRVRFEWSFYADRVGRGRDALSYSIL